MEFLFMGQWASVEAILVLTCVGIFVAIFLYDGFLYLNTVFHIFVPKKENEIPAEPETIGVLTAMPVIADHTEEAISEETQESRMEEIQDTIESVTNDDLLELNVTGDSNEGDKTETPETQPDAPIIETEVSETVETQEESTLTPQTNTEIQTIEEAPVETPETVIESVVPETTVDDTISDKAEEAPIVPSEPEEAKIEEESVEAAEGETPVEVEEVNMPQTKKDEAPRTNHTETLFALTNNVRTLIARGQTLEARGLIIQGLALDKGHRELNMMLAGLYEQDRHFEKAEYIYKDLALEYPNDVEILEKLGNVLIIERRYEIALEMYKKILGLTGETEGTLYILTHLSNELGQHEISYEYSKRYQKRWPNNPEILTIMAQNEIALGNRKDAIQTLIKLKNLTPYNQEIADLIQKLVLEEELAGNFGN